VAATSELVCQIQAAFEQDRLDLATAAIAPDPATSNKYNDAYAADLNAVDQAIAAYRSGAFAGDPAVVRDLISTWTDYRKVVQEKQAASATANDFVTWTRINESEIAPIAAKVTADVRALGGGRVGRRSHLRRVRRVQFVVQPDPVRRAARRRPDPRPRARRARGRGDRPVAGPGQGGLRRACRRRSHPQQRAHLAGRARPDGQALDAAMARGPRSPTPRASPAKA
jgi:hypothetical protein